MQEKLLLEEYTEVPYPRYRSILSRWTCKARVQQVGVYFGPERVNTDNVPAGNIVYVAGARGAIAGKPFVILNTKL